MQREHRLLDHRTRQKEHWVVYLRRTEWYPCIRLGLGLDKQDQWESYQSVRRQNMSSMTSFY